MICRAAASCSTDETEALPAICSHFINQENAGMAQYDLVHQFKEQGFHDVNFTVGTSNALYVGGFLYADSSTPSNFTIFAFHKQELNSDNRQHDYLICHLIQVEGQKIFGWNQSIVEAIGSRTFQFQQTWNPNPTIWSSLDNLFWWRQCLHIESQPTTHHDW